MAVTSTAMTTSPDRSSPQRASGLRLAADIGGTFTDVAVFDDRSGTLRFGKVLSTPDHLPDGITEGVGKAG
jgi:N-methylhydantoinase A